MRTRGYLFAATMAAAAALTALPAPAADWPQWRGPNRDGKSPDKGLLRSWPPGGPKQLWATSEIGIGYSSPIVVGDTIYITGDTGHPDNAELWITALDPDGKVRWKKKHGPGWTGPRSPGALANMACDDGLLYAMSAVGLLKCFDAGTGDERWAVDVPKEYQGEPPGWGYSEAPVVFENKVIVSPGGQNGFVALDKKTGKTIWQCPEPKGHPGHSSSIVVDFRGHAIVVRLSGIGMAACDARTGKSLWINKRAVGGAAVATPVHWEGYVFGATAYNNGGACVKLGLEGDTVTATQVWETKEMQNHHGGFVVVDGYLYGNHLSGWTCIDMKTGEVKWYDDGVGKGSLAYADGMLYTYSEGAGRIGLVEATPTGYRRTGEFSVRGRNNSWPHPVIINGRLYLRYWDTLYCFDVTRGRP